MAKQVTTCMSNMEKHSPELVVRCEPLWPCNFGPGEQPNRASHLKLAQTNSFLYKQNSDFARMPELHPEL